MCSMRLRINSPMVAHQNIEGESILIHFETGCYYSSDNLGAEIFSRFEQGASIDQIVHHLVARYHARLETVERAVADFVDQLQREQLIVPDGVASSSVDASDVADPEVLPEEKAAFEAPTLHKYSDLQDLLLLDPIHDIEQEGWPVTSPGSEEPCG